MKEKQYEVRLQAVEDSHRQAVLELREMLTAQQQMSAKYVSSSLGLAFCRLCFNCCIIVLYLSSHIFIHCDCSIQCRR